MSNIKNCWKNAKKRGGTVGVNLIRLVFIFIFTQHFFRNVRVVPLLFFQVVALTCDDPNLSPNFIFKRKSMGEGEFAIWFMNIFL